MINFDDILKDTLTTINEGFEIAQRDLISVIEAVAESIKNTAGETFTLDYLSAYEDFNGSIYRITFDENPDDMESAIITIDYFRVPAKGYPIEQGVYFKSKDEFKKNKIFDSKTSLELYFREMLMNPDSSLIQAIGFATRKSL